jgi:tripartite-type tricarboxylate transporter receptor subunit TctC
MLLVVTLAAHGAAAQDGGLYKGRSITLFAGQPPGGGIDSEMRLVAQFYGKHIPGAPNIVARNMPGAGGLVLGNHLFTIAKPDGLTLGMPGRSGFVLAPIISAADTKYDLRKFTWIGSSASTNFVLWMRKGSGIRTFAELKQARRPIVIAGSGSTTSNSIIPEVLARYEGIPIKVVRGYPGIADAVLAVERGEADGVLCQRASIRPDMLASGAVVPLAQFYDVEKGVPLLLDLVTSAQEKALLGLLMAPQKLGLPVVAPPGVPAEVTRVLREAYLKMVATGEYREEAGKRGFDVGTPNSGEAIGDYVTNTLMKFPAETIAEYRTYVERR